MDAGKANVLSSRGSSADRAGELPPGDVNRPPINSTTSGREFLHNMSATRRRATSERQQNYRSEEPPDGIYVAHLHSRILRGRRRPIAASAPPLARHRYVQAIT
ncbi:unnamed protein product [Arctia plantaginis]|uniref:Uncharacterized protein n=1 Tax=Arctia plantaginis TaxID=874455 RepID=A0A8S1ASW7_ARCPL|nr:unnamed protein product [Arctia plantaginis]